MAGITLESLTESIDNVGVPLVATRAAVAYLNLVLEPVVQAGSTLTTPQLLVWIKAHMGLLPLTLQRLEPLRPDQVARWVVDTVTRDVITAIQITYTADDDEVEYQDLTLTPWDIAEAINSNSYLYHIFKIDFRALKLRVDVSVNGRHFTHYMTMDEAMGLLLVSQAAHHSFHMTMYGAPLSYFRPGESTRYDRYENVATEGEFSIRMIGTDPEARHYFFGTEFLRGIKTGAEWLGVDHHDYWVKCQDAEGQPLTF